MCLVRAESIRPYDADGGAVAEEDDDDDDEGAEDDEGADAGAGAVTGTGGGDASIAFVIAEVKASIN